MTNDKQCLVKVTILAYRKPGMSEEDFHHHWTTIHPPLVRDWLIRHGIVRYTQYHTPSSIRSEAQQQLTTFGDAVVQNMIDYDGLVELLMPSAQCFDNARKDPYYESTVKPDEDSFADMSRSKFLVGWEEVYIDNGTAVENSQTKTTSTGLAHD